MKKQLLLILFFTISFIYGQTSFGVKAGLNYNTNDNLNISGGFVGINENFSSEGQIGYTLGLFGNIDLGKIYLQPELLFSQTTSSYDQNPDFKLSYLEVPVLLGYNIINNFSLYIGPSAQFIIDNEFFNSFDLDFNKKTVIAVNIGASIKIDKFGIDLRYLKGLSDNLAVFDDNIAADGFLYSLKTKSSQVVLSLSYELN